MILEHFISQSKPFRPTNIEQYTVFQIARRFNADNLRDYLLAAEHQHSSRLIKAYRAAKNAADKQKAFFKFINH